MEAGEIVVLVALFLFVLPIAGGAILSLAGSLALVLTLCGLAIIYPFASLFSYFKKHHITLPKMGRV